MSDKTLNDIIKEEFTKLMSELDQNIISGAVHEAVNAFGQEITPEMVAAAKKRKAQLQQKLPGQRKTAAASEKAARTAAVTDRVARGADPAQAADREGISLADYGDQTAKTGPAMAGVPKGLPAAKNIARANRQGKRALARRRRRKAGQKAIGGDYDKFYADLDAAGLGGMLDASGGRDKKFGKGHQAAFDALQAHKSKMSVPAEKSETAETWATKNYGPDAKPGEGNLLIDPESREPTGYRTGQQSIALRKEKGKYVDSGEPSEYEMLSGPAERGEARPDFVKAPAIDLSDVPDPQGMSEPEEKMVASKPKPFRFDLNPMQESKQYDRMKLLAGVKKKDK